jgi:hypothetical protein
LNVSSGIDQWMPLTVPTTGFLGEVAVPPVCAQVAGDGLTIEKVPVRSQSAARCREIEVAHHERLCLIGANLALHAPSIAPTKHLVGEVLQFVRQDRDLLVKRPAAQQSNPVRGGGVVARGHSAAWVDQFLGLHYGDFEPVNHSQS